MGYFGNVEVTGGASNADGCAGFEIWWLDHHVEQLDQGDKDFVVADLGGVAKEFVALARGVAAIGGVEAVFVQGANDAPGRVYPTIAKRSAGMRAGSGKSKDMTGKPDSGNVFAANGNSHYFALLHGAEAKLFCFVPVAHLWVLG